MGTANNQPNWIDHAIMVALKSMPNRPMCAFTIAMHAPKTRGGVANARLSDEQQRQANRENFIWVESCGLNDRLVEDHLEWNRMRAMSFYDDVRRVRICSPVEDADSCGFFPIRVHHYWYCIKRTST
jgi:hypothetical protein